MSDVYTDLLHSYLNGNEWKRNIETFVESNCSSFKNINEYNHTHYDIWKNFKEIVEQILDMTLSEVGGSIEALEKSFDEIAGEIPKGPRDEIAKEILNRLLTYDDFLAFAKMMKDEANSWNDSMTLSRNLQSMSGHYDTLISMGFSEEMIQLVLHDSTPEECNDLESLVMKLSAIDASSNDNSNSDGAKAINSSNKNGRIIDEFDSFNHTNDYHEIDSREKNRLYRLGSTDNSGGSSSDRPVIAECKTNAYSNQEELYPHLADFASELATYTSINTNANELNVKFVMAGSLIDTVNSTVGMWDNKSGENGQLLEWASNMITLLEEIIDCYKKNESYRDRAAKTCRLSSSLSLAEATNGENGLLGWFANLEELRAVVDSQQSEESILNHGEVERMAVLEHIASMGTDDERLLHSLIIRHDQVQSDINNLHVKCGGMVAAGIIGRMHLEELYLELKNKLNSGTDIDNFSEELHEQVYSVVKDAQKGSSVVKNLLDMHILEDEQAMLKSEINSLLGGQGSPNGSPMKATTDNDLGLNRDDKLIEQDAKLTEISNTGPALSLDVGDKDDDTQVSVDLVNELKDNHKRDLAKLKAGLAHTKEQRLQALEERLARRRRAYEKENDPGNKESIASSISELEDEITRAERQFQEIHKGIIGGFKKRCVHEMRVLKEKKSALSDQDRHRIALDAGKGIIDRHERDQKVLLQNLETERSRQRNRLLKKLSKRKKEMGITSNSEEGRELHLQIEKELKALDDAFDAQEEGALSEPRQKMLVTLSAAFLPHDVFTNKENNNDDDYMDEEDSEHKNFLGWVTTTERLTDKYSAAGQILQKRFRRAQRKGHELNVEEDEVEEDEEAESGMASVTAHMMKVIAEAFASQMQSNDGSSLLKNSGDLSKLFEKDEINENELIKAGILNEFERLREAYDVALETAQLSSRARLEKRRAKAWEGGDNWDMDPLDAGRGMESVTHTQALFEEVIDDFLHDPLKVIEEDKSPRKQGSRSAFDSNTSSHPMLGGGGNLASSYPITSSKLASSDRDKTVAHAITAAHKDAQMDLLEGLNSHMIKMKRSLDARVARRRESKAAEGKTDEAGNAEDQQLQAKLEESHRVMVNMIKDCNESDCQKMKLENITAAVDVVFDGGTLPSGILPPSVQNYIEAALADASRRQMTQHAQRISDEFNEENQKLDLMMKVQQARQRQMLQRKLLQRKGRAKNDMVPVSAARGGQLPPLRSLPRPGESKQPIPFGGLRATPNQMPVSGIDPNMWGGAADDKDVKN